MKKSEMIKEVNYYYKELEIKLIKIEIRIQEDIIELNEKTILELKELLYTLNVANSIMKFRLDIDNRKRKIRRLRNLLDD